MGPTVYFLRHGQTALSRADVFCGSGLDPDLTAEGLAMAEAFRATYLHTPWSAIFSSKLKRTIATAKPLCDSLHLDLQIRGELNEIAYGKWEGLTKEKVDQTFHDDYADWLVDPAWHAPTSGETAVLVAARALPIVAGIKQQLRDGNVLVVSHKATIRIILCSLLGIDVGSFRYRLGCPVGSVSVVEFTRQGPLLHKLADRSHLSESLRLLPGT